MWVVPFPGLLEILVKEGIHFLLGFVVGLLVYYLTWTILFTMQQDGHGQSQLRGDSCIHSYLFWLCIWSSIIVHILEDVLIDKF